MGNKCAESLTMMEMLDAVEAGIAILRSRTTSVPAPVRTAVESAANLRAEMQAAGVSAIEFARAARVSHEELESWIAGTSRVPEWVPAAIQLVSLLAPSVRRKLLYGQTGLRTRPVNDHPFSRIEEL